MARRPTALAAGIAGWALLLAACGAAEEDSTALARDRVTLEALLGEEEPGPAAATSEADEAETDRDDAVGVERDRQEQADGLDGAPATNGSAAAPDRSADDAVQPDDVDEVGGRGASDTREMGQGVTEDTITIGFQYAEEFGAALEAFGYGGSDGGGVPDEREIVRALVDWVNANGGIAGREVVPVLHGTNQLDGTFASQAQAACSTFTEDNEVFAAGSTGIAGSQHLTACMAERTTPLIENTYYPFDATYFERYDGWLYTPGRMRPEHGLVAMVDGLAAEGFFDEAVLGLARYDSSLFDRTTEQVLKPRLSEHGVELAEEVEFSTPASAGDVGGLATEVNNAILQFRSAGVTHVLFWEYPGAVPFLFLPQAESQGYRPAYGFMSYSSPVVIAENSPEAQLENAWGVGWSTPADIADAQHPGGNAAWERCLEILDAGGLDMTYPRTGYYAQPHCDTVFFLQEALERAPALTAGGLRDAVRGLGDDYLSPQTFATQLGPGRPDGAAAYRPFAYDPSVEGFVYTGELQRTR